MKVTRKAAEALWASVEHWLENALVEHFGQVNIGAEYCPCCQLWNSRSTRSTRLCTGCPIHDFTGLQFCEGTPFNRVDLAYAHWDLACDDEDPTKPAHPGQPREVLIDRRDRFIEAATAEYEFMVDLACSVTIDTH